jgi:energy-coupling factor transporter ATP-binding protein EcfA2
MPHVIGVMGRLGAGKTTIATILAHLYKQAIESRGGWIELFANYQLTSSQWMRTADDWFKVADAHGTICVWDEAHRSFDSRKSTSFQNILATDILTFCRKMASIQIFVTPSIKRLDTRIREMLEVLIIVRPMGNKGIRFDYYDFTADAFGPYGQFLHSRFLPAYKVAEIHRLNLFDSHSFVSGFPLPKTEREAIKFMEELEKRHDEGRKKIREVLAI